MAEKRKRICANCGGAISARRSYHALTCSKDCANAARRRFHAEHPGANSSKHPGNHSKTRGARNGGARQGARARERRLDPSLALAAEAQDEPPPTPRPVLFRLKFDRRVVIGPPQPAPVKRYADTGRPCEFQDDQAAIADRGSPRHQMLIPDRPQARASSLVGIV